MERKGRTILHVIDTTGPGGAETVYLSLLENLHIEGCKNLALITGKGWVANQLIKRNVDFVIIEPRGFLSIGYYFRLLNLIKTENVDLVHAHLLGSILSCSLVCWLLRVPLVATFHGQVDVSPNERHAAIKRLIIRFGVSKMVAVSKALSRYIESIGLGKSGRVITIYNGVDVNNYLNNKKNYLRPALSISPESLLVGCLGNIRPAKNYQLMLDVAAKINSKKSNDVHFVIAGHQKEPLMSELKDRARLLNVDQNVHWIGYCEDTAGFLSEIDIFLLCSDTEGFSIATIEAMSARLPVISTLCGGPEEIIEHGITGFLVPKNDSQAIVTVINRLKSDINFAKKIGENGADHVKNYFSIDAMIDKYKNVYGSLLAGKKKILNFEEFIKNNYGSRRGLASFISSEIRRLIGEYRYFEIIDFKQVNRLVFVCQGNICRSPLGEAVAKKLGLNCTSFGLDTEGDAPADERAQHWASTQGYDLNGHLSKRVDNYLPQKGDLLIAMEPAQGKALRALFINCDVQITLAGLWLAKPQAYIHDPFNSSAEYFRKCEEVVEMATLELARRLC